jgi:hypothetical protein
MLVAGVAFKEFMMITLGVVVTRDPIRPKHPLNEASLCKSIQDPIQSNGIYRTRLV